MQFCSVWKTLLIAASVVLLAACDSAGFSLNRGDPNGAYQLFLEAQGGDDNAMRKLMQRVDKNDPWAALQVGYILQTGAGRYKANFPQAIENYQRCQNKIANCAFNLGLIYLNGQQVEPPVPDVLQAITYFQKAAGQQQNKHLQAAMQLGNIYEHGFGAVPQNFGLAIGWYMAASGLNDPVADFRLGVIKMSGDDGQKDVASARDYLLRASNQYHYAAQYYLAKLMVEEFDDPKNAAQWLVVASVRSPVYKPYADEFLSRLSVRDKSTAMASGKMWANSHRPPAPVDYNSPRNKDK